MYERQPKPSSKPSKPLPLTSAEAPPSAASLREMSYAEGRAHLAPALQLRANAESEGGDREKLLALVGGYVDRTFGGDMQRAFEHYAKGGSVDQDGVTKMLVDAGVKKAFGFVKWLVIPGMVMDHFDTDGDGKISPAEFDRGLSA